MTPPPIIPAPPTYTGRRTTSGLWHKTDLTNWRADHSRRFHARELLPGVLVTADLIPTPSAVWTLTGHLSLTIPSRWGLASTISIAVATRISAEVATDADLVALLRSDAEADLATARALLDALRPAPVPTEATP